VNGGFAEYALADENFVYPIPDGFDDLQAAPLLCAGIIGFRCLRIAAIERGAGIERAKLGGAKLGGVNLGGVNLGGVNLGIYGFGAAGHVCLQVARYLGANVFVCTREEKHRRLAADLGAAWVGGTIDAPPEKLDASIIFAPAGELVPPALAALKKGGTLVLGGIHMSPIPSFPYSLIYHERSIRSVANNTRQDGHDFLRLAAEIPVKTEIQIFPLTQVNQALNALKGDGIRGAGVIRP
jgi:propanol-preferring alcohol dehydrogenase